MQYLLCYLAQGQEQEKDVLDVMANFFAKYGEKFEGLPHIFYFDVDFDLYYSEDEFSGDEGTRRKQGFFQISSESQRATPQETWDGIIPSSFYHCSGEVPNKSFNERRNRTGHGMFQYTSTK